MRVRHCILYPHGINITYVADTRCLYVYNSSIAQYEGIDIQDNILLPERSCIVIDKLRCTLNDVRLTPV